MNALGLDTSTEVLCLCACRGDSWASLAVRRGLQHSPALLPLVDRLLAELGMGAAELQLLVCSRGPGSFTGIRIGLATAQGIGLGRGIPVVGVSSLDTFAWPWRDRHGDVIPVIDARKGKVYAAVFRAGERRGEYRDVSPAGLADMLGEAHSPLLCGPDAPRIRELLGEAGRGLPVAETVDPRALLALGERAAETGGGGAGDLRPLYLRKSEAEVKSGR